MPIRSVPWSPVASTSDGCGNCENSATASCGVAPETLRHALLRNPDGSATGPLGAVLDMLAWRASQRVANSNYSADDGLQVSM